MKNILTAIVMMSSVYAEENFTPQTLWHPSFSSERMKQKYGKGGYKPTQKDLIRFDSDGDNFLNLEERKIARKTLSKEIHADSEKK